MPAKADADFLREARERFTAGLDADRANRKRDEDDRNFHKGEHWTSDELTERAGRITLTIPRTGQFVRQVTGEMRQNKPAIRALPKEEGREELAQVYSALIRHIESQSDAHRVYNKAGEQSVIGGIGWYRILTDYLDQKSFDQEICIKTIRNPLSVVHDPDARGLVREDMSWAFVTELISRKKFEKAHPDVSLTDFDSPNKNEYSQWIMGDNIRIAEYWHREAVTRKLALFTDKSTDFVDDIDLNAINDDRFSKGLEPLQIERIREVEAHKVKWCRMTGTAKIDEGEWKGKWIPLIPVIGEEIEAGDEIFRHGLVHFLKDSNKSYDYTRSAMVERAGNEPKAPWLVTANNVKNYKPMWENANKGNPAALVFDPDPTGFVPQRIGPPQMAGALYQEAELADQDMKAVSGIYDTGLGAPSNEVSGKAIIARDQQGDTSTYVYVDNLSASIRHTGMCLVDLIPHIYSDERIIRIMGEDGSIESYAKVNTLLPDGTTFNDLGQGSYDVEVTTGPAYATKRQLAADSMIQFMQAVPQAGVIAGDLVAGAMDWPNADKFRDRLQMTLPPGIDPEADKKRMEMAQQMNGGQEPPPSPEQQAMMAEQQMQQAKMEQEAMASQAKLQLQAQEAEAELELAAQKQAAELQLAREKFEFEKALAIEKAGLEREIAEDKARLSAVTAAHGAELKGAQFEHSAGMAERSAEHSQHMAERKQDSSKED